MTSFFDGIPKITYDPQADHGFAYRSYNPDEVLMGKTMSEHLRFAVAYWHSFAWAGGDPFGGQTFERPWFGDTMDHARTKADTAFDMFKILGQPYFCFHDADVRPEGTTFAESTARLHEIIFAYAAATVKECIDVTHKLGGENYVLWGGREGYETLLNTDMKREREQAGRFLQISVEYARKIGFKGAILIEPKPQEPTKHQYDYDVATVYGFLKDYGLENEVKVNIEQGHAILAGHSFEHELALASALGIFGSIDMNRNDYQSGWDTDQFPNSVPEVALAYYEVLKAGGFTTGGTNFDAKLRRQSLDPQDLILAHIGAMDVCAKGMKAAAAMLEDGRLEAARDARYAGWDSARGLGLLDSNLETINAQVKSNNLNPQPASGRQEMLENLVNRYL